MWLTQTLVFQPMDERPIYLDYNATTPVLPEVVDAMLPAMSVAPDAIIRSPVIIQRSRRFDLDGWLE